MKKYQMTALDRNDDPFDYRIGCFRDHKKALMNFAMEIWSTDDFGTLAFYNNELDELCLYIEASDGTTVGRVGINEYQD